MFIAKIKNKKMERKNYKWMTINEYFKKLELDAPPNSWIDSITSPKVKVTKGQGVGHAPWLATLWR